MNRSYPEASPEAIIDYFQAQKQATAAEIRGDSDLTRLLARRAGSISFQNESTEVMLSMSADLLAGLDSGKSRSEHINDDPRQFSDSEEEAITSLASRYGMIRQSRLQTNWLDSTEANKVVVAEGGANYTSIDRRNQAFEALGNIASGHIYQLGSGRTITALRPNGLPNPEYSTATTIAPTLQDMEGEPFSEYEVNLGTALAGGWIIHDPKTMRLYHRGTGRLDEAYALASVDEPDIYSLKPKPEAAGRVSLRSGLAAVHQIEALDGKELVIATSSQYAPKATLQAALELGELGVTEASIATATDTNQKSARTYALEIAVLLRQFAELD